MSTKPAQATEVVARKIMEIADRGARTPTMIFLDMEGVRGSIPLPPTIFV